MSVRITVASFNIRNGLALDGRDHWLFRRRTTLDWARRLDADVIGFQEVYGFQRRALAKALPDHAVAGRGRSRWGLGEQVPIFVRPPLRVEAVEHRWFGATPTVPGSLLADSKPPRMTTAIICSHETSDLQLRILDTHLDHRSEENRMASARQLVADFDDDLPSVLLGDFNARPDRSDAFRILAEAGWRRLAYDGSSFNGWEHGTGHPSGPIDHILIRDGADWAMRGEDARIVSAETGRMPSDHWPLVAGVEAIPQHRPST